MCSRYSAPSYLRTRPAQAAIQFTVDQELLKQKSTLSATVPSLPRVEPSPAPVVANGNVMGFNAASATSSLPSPTLTPTITSSAELPRAPTSVILAPAVETSASSSSSSISDTSANELLSSASSSSGIVGVTPSSDNKTQAELAAEKDPEFAAALERQRQRKLEEEKLLCSLENKEACLMCSA